MKTTATIWFLFLRITVSFAQENFSFDRTEYTFDTLYQDETGTAVFLLKNEGKDTLLIADLEPSAAWVTVSFSPAPVLPGRCSMLIAYFNSTGRNGKQESSLEAAVIKNNGKGKTIHTTLILQGNVRAGKRPGTILKLNASEVDMGIVKEGNEKYLRMNFTNAGKAGLKIEELKFKGIPFLYSFGYYHSCSSMEEKALVGSNEIIRSGEQGAILLKLSRTDLKPGSYETDILISGNFRPRKMKLRFKVEDEEPVR